MGSVIDKVAMRQELLRELRFSPPSINLTTFLLTHSPELTWCVQVLRSPKEAFAAAMQSWRERCEKRVRLQGDYVEK